MSRLTNFPERNKRHVSFIRDTRVNYLESFQHWKFEYFTQNPIFLTVCTRPNSALPLGHSSVKSLSTKFSNSSSPANSEKSNGGQNGGHSRPEAGLIEEQKRLIESLRQQVTSKDRRIQQLEDQVRMLSLPLKPTESAHSVTSPTPLSLF